MLSPSDVTRLSEHNLRVSDVWCLSGVTIRSLVREWLDAEGLDVRPCREWVRKLLRGMRLSYKKPALCVKELHSPEQQHANTHRLCWLVDKDAVCADRVVNIHETSCRLLPVHQIAWGRPQRQTSSAAGQHEGGHDMHGRLQHATCPQRHEISFFYNSMSLRIVERQKSRWTVSGVDRREIGLFCGHCLGPISSGESWLVEPTVDLFSGAHD